MSVLRVKNGNSWVALPAGGVGVPSGGTTGQILAKSSSIDYATQWANPTDIGLMLAWVHLWENASPTSTFAGQTIPLDLSDYDFVLILFKWKTDDPGYHTSIGKIGLKTTSSNIYNTRILREFTASTTGVQFLTGYSGAIDEQVSGNNSVCIPVSIYGIKGVIAL